MSDNIQGKVWKYGDDINTDVIFPGKYTYTVHNYAEMAQYALEDLDPTFAKQVQTGDILVVGKNFGNGSSREQAAICLREAGVSAVIGKSFARIWYRNAINNGLLAIVCPAAVEAIETGQSIAIDMQQHQIIVNNTAHAFAPFSQTAVDLLNAGGLLPYTIQKLQAKTDSN